MVKKVTLYSEGMGADTKVINEDGTVVDGLYSAQVNIEAGNVVTVELIMKAQAVDIKNASVTECNLSCPFCGGLEEHTCS